MVAAKFGIIQTTLERTTQSVERNMTCHMRYNTTDQIFVFLARNFKNFSLRQLAISVNLRDNNRRERRVTQRKKIQRLNLNSCSKFQNGYISIKTINKKTLRFLCGWQFLTKLLFGLRLGRAELSAIKDIKMVIKRRLPHALLKPQAKLIRIAKL